jgi:hypothetical protein
VCSLLISSYRITSSHLLYTRGLRLDTLSQLLTFGNVHAGGRFLVVDDTQGMLVSAVLDRMGGYGQVLAIHDGEHHNFDVMRYLNYPRAITEPLRTIGWSQLLGHDTDENSQEEQGMCGTRQYATFASFGWIETKYRLVHNQIHVLMMN